MKGTVISTWIQSLENLYGPEVIQAAFKKVDWEEDRVITPLEDIPDEESILIIETVAASVDKTASEIWNELGKMNIKTFHKWFPSYFQRYSLKGFLMMMDTVHAQLTKMIKGANPPRLIAKEIAHKKIEILYKSKRGMFDYFLGLLEGSAQFFNENIETQITEKGKLQDGTHYLRVEILLEKDDKIIKNYTLSKLFSFGFIKSLPLKIAASVTIIFTILTFPLLYTKTSTIVLGVLPCIVFGAAAFISRIVLAPLSFVQDELKKLSDLDFTGNAQLNTGDHFQEFIENMNQIKENIKTDFLFLKGGTDDMHSFTLKFSEVAKNMEMVSDGISGLVQEVANGAVHQAEETEQSVYVLNDNIENLNRLAKQEAESKSRLELSVENIRSSFIELKNVASSLLNIKNDFSMVNEQGESLSRRVEDIIEIVSTVEQISDQTNLLALNAAIEAARAGEMGRGFTVVAQEIRNLAEDTKEAVQTIGGSLQGFVSEVQQMVQQVTRQFYRLEESNKTLDNVSIANENATNEITTVSNQIVILIEALTDETKKISDVFQNIHSLAAIAEENSAATEEMSANVIEYSSRIKELIEHIQQLGLLTDNLKTELKKYQM